MQKLVSALLIAAVGLTLAADNTGKFSALVTGKDGKPIPGASITLERTDSSWSKKLAATSASGKTLQLGLEPKEFRITVSAPGYLQQTIQRKVPLDNTLYETFVLTTPEQATAAALAPQPAAGEPHGDPLEEGTGAYNSGIALFKEKKYVEALPLLSLAYRDLAEAAASLQDRAAKADLQGRLPAIERVYAIDLVEAGKADAKPALILQAEPFLLRAYQLTPQDPHLVASLLTLAETKPDAAAAAQYQAALDALLGPRPGLVYNRAVEEFQANHPVQAKKLLLGIIDSEPNFTDSYYLLGVVEYSLSSSLNAKLAFKKYLEKAPTGTHASEVKDLLKELK